MKKKRYNLLIITPDQLRADYLSCYGHPTIHSVHIDRLSEKSVRFDNCYCAAPLCGPSRISFATGTYFSEHNHRNYGSEIDPKVPNLITAMKQWGYKTGMFGKNHLFTYDKLLQIWDELDEICLGNYDRHPDYKHSFSSFTLQPDHEYNITGRLTDEIIDFMKRCSGDTPFVAWVNYQDPHPAFTCPPPYDSLFRHEDMVLPPSYTHQQGKPVRNEIWWRHSEMELATENDIRKAMAMYMGQIRYVDDSVGRIMDFLEKSGLDENTIILFFSDHGELLGDHGLMHKLPVFYECLAKIPVILHHPDKKWELDVFKGLVEEVDLAPTLLDLLGADIPPTMVGKSLAGALDSGNDAGRETVLVEAGGGAPTLKEPIPAIKLKAPFAPTSFGPGAMLRKGNWKLSMYSDDCCELYNIEDDPHEMENLYINPLYQDIRNELTVLLLKRLLSVKVRDVGIVWPTEQYPVDVRFAPLE